MPRRIVPVERVLNLWAAGKTAPEIVKTIGPVGGMKFTNEAILKVVTKARNRGDKRAKYRNPLTTSRFESIESKTDNREPDEFWGK
jgi:hypothetical protein